VTDGAAPDRAGPGDRPTRVLLLGATGTIGRATASALVERGYHVVSLLRGRAGEQDGRRSLPDRVEVRFADVLDPVSIVRDGFRGERFDAVISCMASRTGVAADAWAVDHRAHLNVLTAAKQADVEQFVLLSAICVQKPRLAFQHAKLAFEAELQRSDLTWSIVRPTAYFKSLSGQVARVKAGEPFLIFGDGTLTACKPIGDRDLADYLVGCLEDPGRQGRVLPIGGPGPAETPRRQGERLFELLGREPRFRSVPPALLDAVAGGLGLAGAVVPSLAVKAELARIGRYYATGSMLVWDPVTGRYDPDATPETGTDTLADFHARLLRGEASVDLGGQAVFSPSGPRADAGRSAPRFTPSGSSG
jgi:divinyl chlorophyllide a 8-vinyl-reductase